MAVSAVVCGPDGVAGVTYVLVSGAKALCGTDSGGNGLVLQVSTLQDDQPVMGGDVAGLQIGGAMLGVLAAAWSIRALHRLFQSSGEA